jgi:L-cysteine S-thiosulfotransferase
MTRPLRRWSCAAAMVLAVALGAEAGEIPANERRSDYALMGPELRRMQDDDSANPGMLWVLDGEVLWRRKDGSAGKACADCHGEVARSMKGVAARYPAFDQTLGQPIDLEGVSTPAGRSSNGRSLSHSRAGSYSR